LACVTEETPTAVAASSEATIAYRIAFLTITSSAHGVSDDCAALREGQRGKIWFTRRTMNVT
jgi:hypothetical protein